MISAMKSEVRARRGNLARCFCCLAKDTSASSWSGHYRLLHCYCSQQLKVLTKSKWKRAILGPEPLWKGRIKHLK